MEDLCIWCLFVVVSTLRKLFFDDECHAEMFCKHDKLIIFFLINTSVWFSGFKESFLWVWYLYICIILLGLQTLTILFLFVEYIFKVIKASSHSLSFRKIVLSYIRKFCSTLNFLKILKMLTQTFYWKLEKRNMDWKTFTFLLESKEVKVHFSLYPPVG